MFDWLKLLLAPSSAENDCHEKTYEAKMVFRQFAKILSILEMSPAIESSKGLFEEIWSRFVALAKSIDPSLMLFRFIYTVASINLIDLQRQTFTTVKTVSFGPENHQNKPDIIKKPIISNDDIFNSAQV